MPVMVAFREEIVTGPAGMSLALITTFLKSFWTTWVRNGKPSMLTDGLTGNPLAVNWLAMSFSAIALPTKLAITSTIASTRRMKNVITDLRTGRRRRRGLGAGPAWGP